MVSARGALRFFDPVLDARESCGPRRTPTKERGEARKSLSAPDARLVRVTTGDERIPQPTTADVFRLVYAITLSQNTATSPSPVNSTRAYTATLRR